MHRAASNPSHDTGSGSPLHTGVVVVVVAVVVVMLTVVEVDVVVVVVVLHCGEFQ